MGETTWEKYLKEKKQNRKEKRSKVKETGPEGGQEQLLVAEEEGKGRMMWDLMTRSSSMTSLQPLQ